MPQDTLLIYVQVLLKHLLIAETKHNPLNICKTSFHSHHTMATSSGPRENVGLIILLVLTKRWCCKCIVVERDVIRGV